jgi:hypothetical protein
VNKYKSLEVCTWLLKEQQGGPCGCSECMRGRVTGRARTENVGSPILIWDCGS